MDADVVVGDVGAALRRLPRVPPCKEALALFPSFACHQMPRLLLPFPLRCEPLLRVVSACGEGAGRL